MIYEEEVSFLRTLSSGLVRLDKLMEDCSGKVLSGDDVFELNDTYGFPVDLTALIAREKGLDIDEPGFNAALKAQKERSRKDAGASAEDWVIVNEGDEVSFVGYDSNETDTQVLKYQKIQNKAGVQYKVVLETTPFYAESGGQVGDTGVLTFTTSGIVLPVIDTKKENDLIVHILSDARIETVASEPVKASIATLRRRAITHHHSSTHLMQAALQEVLGKHVAQKGSLVNEDLLRFDFSHFQKVTDEEIKQIEQIVNAKIAENIPLLEERNVPIAEAKDKGAMALFGEKYGDFVRVITFDKNFSVELCGGTHIGATGELGLFKLKHESAVAAGVRRIEAVCGEGATVQVNEAIQELETIKELVKNAKEPVKAVQQMIADLQSLKKRVESYEALALISIKKELEAKVSSIGDTHFIGSVVTVSNPDGLKKLCTELQGSFTNLLVVLVANIEGKAAVAVLVDETLNNAKGLEAQKIIKDQIAPLIKGGGGGQKGLATAGGQDSSNLTQVIETVKQLLK